MIVSVRNLAPARLFASRTSVPKPLATESKLESKPKLGLFAAWQKMMENQIDLMIRMQD